MQKNLLSFTWKIEVLFLEWARNYIYYLVTTFQIMFNLNNHLWKWLLGNSCFFQELFKKLGSNLNHSDNNVARRKNTILSKAVTNDQPSSSPLASSSLVMRRPCRLSLFFFLSSHPSSSHYPPQSRCFSFSLSHSSWAVQGWSLHPLSSQNNRWNSRCKDIAERWLNTQMYLLVFRFWFCMQFISKGVYWYDLCVWYTVCTLNYCGHPARAPFPRPPSPPLRNVRWFAGPPPLPANTYYFMLALSWTQTWTKNKNLWKTGASERYCGVKSLWSHLWAEQCVLLVSTCLIGFCCGHKQETSVPVHNGPMWCYSPGAKQRAVKG